MSTCTTCELLRRRDAGDAPPWDEIQRTRNWDVVHAFGTAVEGWLVLVVRRHVTAVADLTDDEAAQVGFLIRDVSRALQRVLDCPKTYVAQFAEHPQHPHVHVHVIPRAGDLAPDRQGPKIFTELGPDGASVTEARMNDIAKRVRQELAAR